MESISEFLQTSAEMFVRLLPYVLAGIVLSELLNLTAWDRLIRRVCGKNPLTGVIGAVVLGAISPLCTYGTLPIVTHLYWAGTPLAPLASFLAVSSLMNPQTWTTPRITHNCPGVD